MFASKEASGLKVLTTQNCFFNSEDSWSQEVIECLLNLSNQLVAGPVRDVRNSMHLCSTITLLARMIVLKKLRWIPGFVVPSYVVMCRILKPEGKGVFEI